MHNTKTVGVSGLKGAVRTPAAAQGGDPKVRDAVRRFREWSDRTHRRVDAGAPPPPLHPPAGFEPV